MIDQNAPWGSTNERSSTARTVVASTPNTFVTWRNSIMQGARAGFVDFRVTSSSHATLPARAASAPSISSWVTEWSPLSRAILARWTPSAWRCRNTRLSGARRPEDFFQAVRGRKEELRRKLLPQWPRGVGRWFEHERVEALPPLVGDPIDLPTFSIPSRFDLLDQVLSGQSIEEAIDLAEIEFGQRPRERARTGGGARTREYREYSARLRLERISEAVGLYAWPAPLHENIPGSLHHSCS